MSDDRGRIPTPTPRLDRVHAGGAGGFDLCMFVLGALYIVAAAVFAK